MKASYDSGHDLGLGDFGSLKIIGDIFDVSVDQTLHNLKLLSGWAFVLSP